MNCNNCEGCDHLITVQGTLNIYVLCLPCAIYLGARTAAGTRSSLGEYRVSNSTINKFYIEAKNMLEEILETAKNNKYKFETETEQLFKNGRISMILPETKKCDENTINELLSFVQNELSVN